MPDSNTANASALRNTLVPEEILIFVGSLGFN
jgi:hypothetical protein